MKNLKKIIFGSVVAFALISGAVANEGGASLAQNSEISALTQSGEISAKNSEISAQENPLNLSGAKVVPSNPAVQVLSKFELSTDTLKVPSGANLTIKNSGSALKMVDSWDKTFAKSDSVAHTKVHFINRFGITLAADLYVPANIKEGEKLPAIAVSGPFGAVKEQSSGLHAQKLAEMGYVAVAFDPSFTGESGGEPRDMASPDINSEDFSAAVDFLATQEFVDSERIGVVGICGLAGFAISAASADTRIKAIVTTAMYDMSNSMSRGYQNSYTREQRQAVMRYLSEG